jgi:mono/diheme cytochrome c family protein
MLLALCAAIAHQLSRPVLAESGGMRPPQRLSETGLYKAGLPGGIDPRNRPFAPQYPLWSDGMAKKRWVYLPPGTAIDASDGSAWTYPVGTRFWKEFSLNGQKIETRLLWKATPAEWVFATYRWNADGTDAVLAPDDGLPGVAEVRPGRRHGIPSRTDCTACHGTTGAGPLGFNALQLSTDRDPGGIHAEPLEPGMLTLRELVDEGLLRGARADLLSDPPRIRTSSAATRAVLGYLASNCGVCHNGRGEIAALGPTITAAELLRDGDAVATAMIGARTLWQIPGTPDGTSVLVSPGSPDESAILARMRSRAPSSQMPPLGTVVRDQEAVDAIALWVASLGAREQQK